MGIATTTCENGITHAIVSMGETSRVYFIPIHEEEETEEESGGGITPTPHPNERLSDGGSDCVDGASGEQASERPLCACFDFNPRHSSHRVAREELKAPLHYSLGVA